jgi:hypothetical protein
MNTAKWTKTSLKLIPELNLPEKFTGEDLRFIIRALNGNPHHPNVWGYLVRLAKMKGMIIPTGEWVPMKYPTSHARKTPVYTLGA